MPFLAYEKYLKRNHGNRLKIVIERPGISQLAGRNLYHVHVRILSR
jgi:hypothetical protein